MFMKLKIKYQDLFGINNGYVEGIFVKKENQSQGIGKRLLDECKKKYSELELSVYEKNNRAFKFYQREGFNVAGKNIDQSTGEVEIRMKWKK